MFSYAVITIVTIIILTPAYSLLLADVFSSFTSLWVSTLSFHISRFHISLKNSFTFLNL